MGIIVKKCNLLKLLLILFLLPIILSGCGGSSSANTNTTPLTKDEFVKMISDPDSHKGSNVDFYAKIFADVEKYDNGMYIQAYADAENSKQNIIIQIAAPKLNVKKDDVIHVTETVLKKVTGKNAFAGEVSAPSVKATKIEVPFTYLSINICLIWLSSTSLIYLQSLLYSYMHFSLFIWISFATSAISDFNFMILFLSTELVSSNLVFHSSLRHTCATQLYENNTIFGCPH